MRTMMKKSTCFPITNLITTLLTAGLVLFLAGNGLASPHGKAKDKKTGILLVAFGSSEASAQISFEHIQEKTAQACPNVPISWAYTSHVIRHKLALQGKALDSPEVALAKMADQGFTHVVVQSLHTILGEEYEDLQKVVRGFESMGVFEAVALGYPLLATQADLARTVDAILATLPKERKPKEAVVLMGHGSPHPANAFYSALMYQLQLKDPNILIGTVEGYPELDQIMAQLSAKKIKTLWLMPFMSVAGDHAKNDMAGDEPDSWKSVLTQAGYKCNTVLKGTAEYDVFVDIWVDHIKDRLQQF